MLGGLRRHYLMRGEMLKRVAGEANEELGPCRSGKGW
jgi:hypothetical protein